MEKFVNFVANNYVWFLTITIILIFALIGYIYDSKKNKSNLFRKAENELEEQVIESIKEEEEQSLNDLLKKQAVKNDLNNEDINKEEDNQNN